jgi:hypothetical protein
MHSASSVVLEQAGPENRMEVREQKFAVKVTRSWSRRRKDSQYPDPKSV